MAKGPRLPDAPFDASSPLRQQWGELVRILSQHLSDDAAPYMTVDISGSVPVSVSLQISPGTYSLTATTDVLAQLLLSLEKAAIIRVRKT